MKKTIMKKLRLRKKIEDKDEIIRHHYKLRKIVRKIWVALGFFVLSTVLMIISTLFKFNEFYFSLTFTSYTIFGLITIYFMIKLILLFFLVLPPSNIIGGWLLQEAKDKIDKLNSRAKYSEKIEAIKILGESEDYIRTTVNKFKWKDSEINKMFSLKIRSIIEDIASWKREIVFLKDDSDIKKISEEIDVISNIFLNEDWGKLKTIKIKKHTKWEYLKSCIEYVHLQERLGYLIFLLLLVIIILPILIWIGGGRQAVWNAILDILKNT